MDHVPKTRDQAKIDRISDWEDEICDDERGAMARRVPDMEQFHRLLTSLGYALRHMPCLSSLSVDLWHAISLAFSYSPTGGSPCLNGCLKILSQSISLMSELPEPGGLRWDDVEVHELFPERCSVRIARWIRPYDIVVHGKTGIERNIIEAGTSGLSSDSICMVHGIKLDKFLTQLPRQTSEVRCYGHGVIMGFWNGSVLVP
ncbi:hypothetical protein BDW71DRAFT_170833 [Aspergillus fruticulosus]